MIDEIIVAVITGLFSIIGVYIANAKQQAVLLERLNQLEKRVDKHNNVVERLTAAEVEINHLKNNK